MIIEKPEDVTPAVLGEMHRTPDPRAREVLASLIQHLHAFIREVRLTEREFQDAIGYVNAIGQHTTPSHNEAMLMAGALGVSNLVCLLNNGAQGTRPTQATNLGPFYRAGSPRCQNGDSIIRSPTPGPALEFRGWVRDAAGKPIDDAASLLDIVARKDRQDSLQMRLVRGGSLLTLDVSVAALERRE